MSGRLPVDGSGVTQPVSQSTPANLKGVSYDTTDLLYDGSTALTPKRAFANVAQSQTDSSIVAAVAGKIIRVIWAVHQCGALATGMGYLSKPAGAGVAISMTFANGANGGSVLGYNPKGWFQTVVSEGLTVTTGAGSTTGVMVGYVEV